MATAITFTTSTGRVERLVLDAALSRASDLSVEVTKFPVETGAVISDHAIVAPARFQLAGLLSNTPVMAREEFEAAMEAGTVFSRRAQDARDRLREINRNKIPVTVEANGEQHENLIMVSLSLPEDPSTGEAVNFSASFEQIITAATQVETVPKPPTTPGKVKQEGGRKPTEKASEPVKRKTSLTVDAVDAVRGK